MRVVGYKPTSKKDVFRDAQALIYTASFFSIPRLEPWDALLRVPCSLFPLNHET